MNTAILAGIVRHLLTAAGGALATLGVKTDEEIEVLVGVIVAAVGLAWSAWQKRRETA